MLDSETPGSPGDDDLGLTPEELATLDPHYVDPEDESEPTTPAAASPPGAPVTATPTAPPVLSAAPTNAAQAPVPPDGAAPSPPAPDPLVLKIDGKEIPVRGVQLPDGSVQFSREQWTELREKYVANRERWTEKERGYKERVQQAQQAAVMAGQRITERDAQADALTQAFQSMMGLDDEKAVTEFIKLKRSFPQFQAKAEADYWKREAEQGRSRIAPIDEAARWKAAEPEFRDELAEALDQALAQPDHALIKSDREGLLAELWRIGMEEGAIGWNGERYVYDQRTFARHLRSEAFFAKRLEDERAKAAITKRNDAVLKPAITAPPQVPVNTAIPAPPNGERARPKTKQEWQDRLREVVNEPE